MKIMKDDSLKVSEKLCGDIRVGGYFGEPVVNYNSFKITPI